MKRVVLTDPKGRRFAHFMADVVDEADARDRIKGCGLLRCPDGVMVRPDECGLVVEDRWHIQEGESCGDR